MNIIIDTLKRTLDSILTQDYKVPVDRMTGVCLMLPAGQTGYSLVLSHSISKQASKSRTESLNFYSGF